MTALEAGREAVKLPCATLRAPSLPLNASVDGVTATRSMESGISATRKRRRGEATETSACDLQADAEGFEVEIPSISVLHAQSAEQMRIMAACRRVMVNCPSESVDPFLARTLEIVGGYDLEVVL